MTFQKRRFDVDDFPVGCRVKLPSGRTGVVLGHKGYESRQDAFMRVMIKLDGGDRQDMVQLQPHMLRHFEDGRDHIQNWCGDYFQVGDNVRLPTGRTGMVLALMPMRKTESVMFLLVSIDGEGEQQEQAELPTHLVEKLPASWVPPKRPEQPPVGNRQYTLEQDHHDGFSVSLPDTKALKPAVEINIDPSAADVLRSPDAQVLQAIHDLRYDPVAFPASKTTREAKNKRLVRARTDLTRRQFDHTWRCLCADRRIVERRVTCSTAFARGFVQGFGGGKTVLPEHQQKRSGVHASE